MLLPVQISNMCELGSSCLSPRAPGPEGSATGFLYYWISTVTDADPILHMRSDINFMLFTYSCHKVKQFLLLSLMKLHYLNEMHFTDKERYHFHRVEALLANFLREFPKSYLNCLDSCVVYITEGKQCQGFYFLYQLY